MDTTSLYFEGEGGATLGERGHSKDYRPQLNQMIVGVIIDQDGRPICSEMWPGNTADVTTLIPVIDRLRHRFAIPSVPPLIPRQGRPDTEFAAIWSRRRRPPAPARPCWPRCAPSCDRATSRWSATAPIVAT